MVTPNGIIESQVTSFYSPIKDQCYAVINTISSIRCAIACEARAGGCICAMDAIAMTVLYEISGAYLIDKGNYLPTSINMTLNKLGFGPVGVLDNDKTQGVNEHANPFDN